MPELLIELFSEEIPARMQSRAAADLKSLVTDALAERALSCEGARAFATPRRLALLVEGLPARQPELKEERKGPRVGAPEAAIKGFLGSTGLTLDRCRIEEDKKGKFYVAVIARPGRATEEVVAEIVPRLVRTFPWPKSMRWGSGSLRWVRPLHAILCCFDGEVVPFAVDGIRSGNVTRGHRFLAPEPIEVRRFADYERKLRAAKVVLDLAERAEIIRAEAGTLAFARGLELVEDEELLEETAGLAEWPVPLIGTFDEGFLALPPEVVATSIKHHQKCFALKRPGSAELSHHYLLVSNLEARDGGTAIVAGNDRVIRARLSDARFFWDHDRRVKLEARLPALEGITFHARLGTQAERVRRLEVLAGKIAAIIGADAERASLAARLCKADLVTDMVGEFPELQGVMGRYYALEEGLDAEIADAIRDHYKPQGPSDSIPVSKVGQAVALADKLDMLAGFWAIDEKPTGSKDPYGLRRAALGAIRIILGGEHRLALVHILAEADRQLGLAGSRAVALVDWKGEKVPGPAVDLLEFFAERLKVYLRDQGARHDLIDAVFSLGGQDDLLAIVRRVEALGRFLDSDDGKNLLVGTRRAVNILRIEEKRDKAAYDGMPDHGLLELPEEKVLFGVLESAARHAGDHVAREDFAGAMAAVAAARPAVDAFFDKVTVNAEDPVLRENRLKLLNRIRAATLAVADFSRIEG